MSGASFPNQVLTLFDLTAGRGLGNTQLPGGTGNSLTWKLNQSIPAGHKIRATITNVTNPAAASAANQIAIATSIDSGGNSANYTSSAGNALTPGRVTLSNPTTGAAGVTYSVEFTTSHSALLYAAGQGTISLSAPSGTGFPNQVLTLFDLTTGLGLGNT